MTAMKESKKEYNNEAFWKRVFDKQIDIGRKTEYELVLQLYLVLDIF